jgi:4-amino-4-deoxy-L-arabinose transferase-like glycosyltransferase
MKRVFNDKYSRLMLVLLGGFLIFKAFYSVAFPITGDEAYHWEWSRNLALGYYDHPPMIGWLIALTCWIGRLLGGPELFWTRLPGLLSTTGILVLVYLLLVQTTGSRRTGIYGILFLMVTPLFSLGANVVTTDQPLLFFSGLTVYLLYQALFKDRYKYWYYAGLALGCAFLSKFISILLIPGLILFLILSTEHRFWLKRKEPYLGALLAALVYLPNLIWNARHNWLTFMFNLSRGLKPELSLGSFGTMVAGQMGLIGLILFPLLVYGLFRGIWQGVRDKDRTALFFSLLALSVFGFFGLTGLFGQVGAHWTAIGYLPAVVAFFYVFRSCFEQVNLKRGLWWSLHIGLVLSLVITIALHLLLVYNYLLPEKLNIAGAQLEIDHTTFGFFYGWEEVGERINELQAEYDVFFITPHYAISGMLSFNTPGQPFIRLFGQEYITGLNYKYWNNYQELKGKDAIFICKDPRESYIKRLNNSFEKVEKLEQLKIFDPAGHHVRTFHFFYCKGFDGRDMTTTSNRFKF